MTVPNFPVAVSNASWGTFPGEFTTVTSNFETVAVVPSFHLVPHESKECHIYRSHAKLKGFKMEAEILTKTVENLRKKMDRALLISTLWTKLIDNILLNSM